MKCDIFNIWKIHADKLKGYIKKRVSDENDIDDIMQSVLIKITNYCEKKKDVKYIKAWIYRITQNTIIDYYKKEERTVNINCERLTLQTTQEYNENIFIWLHNFIERLPKEYSEPLKLSDIEGKPHQKIAEQLGLTLSATKSRIQRARKKLREKFDECGTVEHSENQLFTYTITKSCCLK